MSHEVINTRWQLSAADTPNIDSAGAVSEFVFPFPVTIKKVALIVTTAVVTDDSTACTLTLTRRPVVGSSSNAVTLGTFNAIAAGVDPAAGSFIWAPCIIADNDGEQPEDYDADTSRAVRFEAPNSNITAPETGEDAWTILPGQSFAMTLASNAEGDSGAVYSAVEYVALPFNAQLIDQDNMTEKTVS